MNIAIAGYGVEGKESYDYWSANSSSVVTIVDERVEIKKSLPENAATILGPGAFEKLDGFDLVVRTAGLSPYKIKTNGKVWSATNEFFVKCPARIIGVTGSKGKGTTASLIASILEAAGKKVWLVGNIGVPALSVLSQIQSDDIVVYELSSFQLWDLQQSPHTAVVLFIEQEHLDVHLDMDDYVAAKAHITKYQTPADRLVFNSHNQYAVAIAKASAAQTIGYPSLVTAHVQEGAFYYGDQRLCSLEALKLVGTHNQSNAVAAIDAIWEYTQDSSAIEAGISAFHGLPHRLAYVGSVDGVAYYDDSIATTPTAAIAALRAFTDMPKVIILGGSYKGSDFSDLAHELARHQVKAVLVGDVAQAIADACDKVHFFDYEILQDATAEVFTKRAAELAVPGGVVLLSPAAASFGLFKNYADRGDQFVAVVRSLDK